MGNVSIGSTTVATATVQVNGAELYYEIRGSGPPLLFIQGMTGDGGAFQRVAERLSDEFTVVTYHRRANSLSPPPDGWTSTTIDEQADDAAALLVALDLAPATVFGTSMGAAILLNLMQRHPDTLRGAILHEPVMAHAVPSGAAFGAGFQSMVETGMATVGLRETMERLIRMVAGDGNVENLDPELRERMLGNAEVFFFSELPAAVSYTPDAGELAACEVPAIAAAGIENPEPVYRESAIWVATQLGTRVQEMPGAHTPYLDHPDALATAIRTLTQELR
jgi:pimeloyl-ACP methyl ester carboxylesterase